MNNQHGTKRGDRVRYSFTCAGCGSSGLLDVSTDERGMLGCPEECGACYLQWTMPDGRYVLTCVVQPFFSRGESVRR